MSELQVKEGWILITRSGSTGITAVVPKAWDGYAISEHVIRIVPDPLLLAPEYIYAFLRTRSAQEAISRGVFGSVIDEIDPEFIGNLEVHVPTNADVLERIVKVIRSGEVARQSAIVALTTGVDDLDQLLG